MEAQRKIPKIIHYCWLGGAPKPQSVLKCIESWRKACPDYEIREWNENNLNINDNIYTQQAYSAKAWGFVPDYLRLWIVYTYGGIYLDTDVEVLRSFDELLDNHAFAGFERGTGDDDGALVNFGQGFGAVAGNEVIYKHMEMYKDLSFILPDGQQNRVPSPCYTTQILAQLGLNRKNASVQDLGLIVVYSEDYFCPKNFVDGAIQITENTYSIHHFDGSWWTDREREMFSLARKFSCVMPRSEAMRCARAICVLRYEGVGAVIKKVTSRLVKK